MRKLFSIVPLVAVLVIVAQSAYAGTLSCTTRTSACNAGEVEVYEMQSTANSHAAIPGSGYTNWVCCTVGGTTAGNSCSTGVNATALWLAGTNNAHVSQAQTNANYTGQSCLSVPTGGTVTVGYTSGGTSCATAGYDATLGSMSASTNAHVGDSAAYPNQICATATAPSAGLPASGTLTSSVFDTTSTTGSAGYNSIMWKGTAGTGNVSFQLATAAAATGPWSYYGGATCGSLDWFATTGPDSPVELKGSACQTAWNNKRYFRYKVKICSASDCVSSGATSPVISSVVVNWAP
jgi:hypothetical protein